VGLKNLIENIMHLQIIHSKIIEMRGKKVILDFHLAELYEVETRTLKQAVRRNMDRFPDDFMFELTQDELNLLKINMRSQAVIPPYISVGYSPMAFTEQGVAMLSSVLRSKKAIEVNIAIMRAFVMLRQYYLDYKELKLQIEKLEKEMNRKFKDINEALKYLLNPPLLPGKKIGYR
jgi:hypothetical protein